ncbi:MAG: cation:proton antiporter [Acidobacteria bacterium]|nr:cation:proton antiporter [Acidobacteriota bacterium]
METFTAAPHADILKLVLQIAVLLFTARALGEVSKKLGQPAVVGEILAGIVLGPSLLSSVIPAFGIWIIPQTDVQGYLLEVISLIGAMFLMLITGIETDLSLIRRHARTAFGVSLCGIALTFTTGYLVGTQLPDFLLANPDQRTVFALFLGTAMSISAIAVIAKVVIDLGLIRRDIGQTLIAAGMSDDTIGWIILSVVAGLAAGHGIGLTSVVQSAGGVLLFLVLSFFLGRIIVRKLIDLVGDHVSGADRFLTLVVVLMFAWGAIAQAIHLEAVLGAFVIGIVLRQMRRLSAETTEKLESIALGVFAPIFFAVAGLKVNLADLSNPSMLGAAGAVIGATVFGKGVGAYVGARFIGRKDHWHSLAFAAGLNTRGAMDIIIATIGLSLEVFSPDMFAIIVLMAMTNAMLAPSALRWVLRHVEPSAEELDRLTREERTEASLIARIHRVLLPIRLRDTTSLTYRVEAEVLARLSKENEIELTLLTVTRSGEKAKGMEFLDRVSELFPEIDLIERVVEGSSPSEIILDEAARGFDLMVLGASEEADRSQVLFNPLVDYLVRVSPCPTLVVQSGSRHFTDWSPERILVPTNGSMAARRAAELSFAIAHAEQDIVTLLNVVARQESLASLDPDSTLFTRQFGNARQIVTQLEELGEAQNIRTDVEVRVGRDPERVILDLAKRRDVDLIILGSDVQAGTQRLFLGPKIEHVLENAPCPVLVLNIPHHSTA